MFSNVKRNYVIVQLLQLAGQRSSAPYFHRSISFRQTGIATACTATAPLFHSQPTFRIYDQSRRHSPSRFFSSVLPTPLSSPVNKKKPILLAIQQTGSASSGSEVYYFYNPETHSTYLTSCKDGTPSSSVADNALGISLNRSESEDLFQSLYPHAHGWKKIALTPVMKILPYFLPSQYPDSVRRGYASYTIWSMAQGIVSSASGGLGFGNSVAAPAAAALTWVMKDGLGQLGGMLFAGLVGRRFDDDAKRWRVISAIALDAAQALEIITPLFPAAFLPLASIANIGKNISWLSSSASKASLHRSLCRSENLAELTAKSGAQSIVASLIGTALGLAIASRVAVSVVDGGVVGMAPMLAVFGVLTVIHLYTTLKSVTSVALNTLNVSRTEFISLSFIQHTHKLMHDLPNIDIHTLSMSVPSPDDVSAEEPILSSYSSPLDSDSRILLSSGMMGRTERMGMRVLLSCWNISIDTLLDRFSKYAFLAHIPLSDADPNNGHQVVEGRIDVHLAFKQGATSSDVLLGYLFVTKLRWSIQRIRQEKTQINRSDLDRILKESLQWLEQWQDKWAHALSHSEWNTQHLFIERNEHHRIHVIDSNLNKVT